MKRSSANNSVTAVPVRSLRCCSMNAVPPGVHIRCDCHVTDVRKSDRFHVGTQTGSLACDSLIIATGGLSFAKLGATDFGYRTGFAVRIARDGTEARPGVLSPLMMGKERISKSSAASHCRSFARRQRVI